MSNQIYTCPTCGEKMERDLLLFIHHTDAHVVEALKKKHPEWVTQDGYCTTCLKHFKAALRGEVVVANIAGTELRKRQLFMIFSIGLGLIASLTLSRAGTPRFWRLFLFFPYFVAILGSYQVKGSHCVVLGMKGARNKGEGEEMVTDPVEKARLRRESQRIILFSFLFAAALTAICFHVF